MLAESRPSPPQHPSLPIVVKPPVAPDAIGLASVYSPSGDRIVTGRVHVRFSDGGWSATISALDRPGVIARAYFTAGLRDVVLALADGRRAPTKISSTSFTRELQRTYELLGIAGFA